MGRKKQIRFRASKVGALMVGTHGLTDNQKERLHELDLREAGVFRTPNGKPGSYTPNMAKEHQELIEKRDAPFELSATAKSFVEQVWLEKMYGYYEPIYTHEILKGHLCEQDSMALVSEVYPTDEFRRKCRGEYENRYFTGHPDILLEKSGVVEDIKSSWSLKTFFETRDFPELYYAQGQVYMDLTGADHFRLFYCLIDTPQELLWREEKRLYWLFGGDSEDYIRASEQLYKNHDYSKIPPKQRVKVFEFGRDKDYMKELKTRVKYAREYFDSLSLEMISKELLSSGESLP